MLCNVPWSIMTVAQEVYLVILFQYSQKRLEEHKQIRNLTVEDGNNRKKHFLLTSTYMQVEVCNDSKLCNKLIQ